MHTVLQFIYKIRTLVAPYDDMIDTLEAQTKVKSFVRSQPSLGGLGDSMSIS